MPLMGLVPMVAMARAATGAKKKAITITRAVPTRAGTRASLMPRPKLRKSRVPAVAVTSPAAVRVPERLRSVRAVALASAATSRFLSAFRLLRMLRSMLGSEASTPITPAPAMAPTPMMRT